MIKEIRLFLVQLFLNLAFELLPESEFKRKYCLFLIENLKEIHK
jgi:hypothetical protein